MKCDRWIVLTGGIGLAAALLLHAAKTDGMNVMTGSKSFTNTASLNPGLARKITAQDLPTPQSGTRGGERAGTRPEGAMPQAPAGFKVGMFVGRGLTNPRQIRRAPNGDIFVADTGGGAIKSFAESPPTANREQSSDFAKLSGRVRNQLLSARDRIRSGCM